MKNLYIPLFLLLCCAANAQVVTFADPDFKAKLLTPNTSQVITVKNLSGQPVLIDTDGDGQIQVSEAENIGEIMILNDWAITDITGISAFSNLKRLIVAGSGLTFADLSALGHLEVIALTNSDMTSLTLPPPSATLFALQVYDNQLTTLDISQNTGITELGCSNNLLAELDVSALVNLQYFSCDTNQIQELEINAPGLININCGNNQLQSLDLSGLPQLITVDCKQNQLTNLNLSGSQVVTLDCSNNLLSEFELPLSVTKLNCSHNQLSALNFGSISELDISYNQFSTLTLTDQLNITKLNCSNNILTELNLNNVGPPYAAMWELNCSHNLLAHLDLTKIYCQLNGLNCSNNNLLSLFVYFVSNSSFDFSENPQLQFICAPETAVSGLQYRATQYGYTCVVNSYCTFSPFGIFYTVNGNSRIDVGANGCSTADPVYPLMRYTITNGPTSGTMVANQGGFYQIDIQSGTHTITPALENPAYFSVSPASFQVSFPSQASPFSQDFCMAPVGNHPDLEVIVFPLENAIPGFDVSYKLICRNKGNTVQSGNVALGYDEAIMDFLQSDTAPASQSAGSLQWDFSGLQPFQTVEIVLSFNLNSPVETPAVNDGDILHLVAEATSAATDETPQDNTFDLNQWVFNSFDPNDKTCLEGNSVGPEMVGEYVHYVIRFENLGTANARNVVVKDMIDAAKFNIATLVPLNGSHPFVTRIADNKVEFIFENINLPFDDANNDGYVAFKIKTKPNLVVGDTFSNSASIYFDYNSPVVTDTATTAIQLLGNPDFEFSDAFTLYPNPAKSVLNIQSENGVEMKSIGIYNLLGQLLQVETGNVQAIDISKLQTGQYLLKVHSDKGNAVTKFIKQ